MVHLLHLMNSEQETTETDKKQDPQDLTSMLVYLHDIIIYILLKLYNYLAI